MAENMGVKVVIAGHLHRSKVISTSGLLVAILNSGNQPTSGNVESVRDVSSMVAKVEVAVGIVSPARCIHYLFSLPVYVTVILNSVVDQRRKMSGNVDSVMSK